MKFYEIEGGTEGPVDRKALKAEYQDARVVGPVRVGMRHFFCKSRSRVFYIRYHEITRCFRRVQLVDARLCCGRGSLHIENFVLCTGPDEKEVLQARLPGERAGKVLLETMEEYCPDAQIGAPEKKAEEAV